MKLLDLKHKLEKGKSLGAEVVYIKEDSLICGVGSIYKDCENKNITLLRSKEESVKVNDFMKILDELYTSVGDVDILIGNDEHSREIKKEIKSVEFAQYELIKMLFINI
ncbi:hypothetical protein [Faecalimicrobium dakarense]|uniref:hypothetical protein n=1 Tax=Faecalimicrobium dakarense TaxID=1301100 RepID=UPI0004B34F94|nr:hypothetical protein [[Clostridium] dakarense]